MHLPAVSGGLCQCQPAPCSGPHYRCNIATKTCVQDDNGPFLSLSDCQAHCASCYPCDEDVDCDFDVQFYYDAAWNSHQCDRAVYRIHLDGEDLGPSYDVNLNNLSNGGSVTTGWYHIPLHGSVTFWCLVTLTLVCQLGGGCHQGVAGLRVRTESGAIIDYGAQASDSFELCSNDICNPAP